MTNDEVSKETAEPNVDNVELGDLVVGREGSSVRLFEVHSVSKSSVLYQSSPSPSPTFDEVPFAISIVLKRDGSYLLGKNVAIGLGRPYVGFWKRC